MSTPTRKARASRLRTSRAYDVCVEFTTPDAVVENIRRVAELGVNLVVGTTGWHNRLEEVQGIVESAGVGMVYGANFSIGVNLFYHVAQAAAEIFAAFPMYDPYLIETHHKFKKDAPSGTALEIKRQIQPAVQEPRDPCDQRARGLLCRHARAGLRLRSGYDYPPAHGARPPGVC